MTRALRRRLEALEALERELRAEADRPLSWADVMDGAMRHEAMLAALPLAEREAKEACEAARVAARRERALSGLMDPAEIDREFPPMPTGRGRAGGGERAVLAACVHRGDRRAALVNLSRRERGLPAGVDWRHPDWPAELARLGQRPGATDVPPCHRDVPHLRIPPPPGAPDFLAYEAEAWAAEDREARIAALERRSAQQGGTPTEQGARA